MISNKDIFKLAEEAGFILWGDESWNIHNSTIDWSSEYDQEIVIFARLIEKYIVTQDISN